MRAGVRQPAGGGTGACGGGVREPGGEVVGGEKGVLLFSELLGEGEPPPQDAGLEWRVPEGDWQHAHLHRLAVGRHEQAGVVGS